MDCLFARQKEEISYTTATEQINRKEIRIRSNYFILKRNTKILMHFEKMLREIRIINLSVSACKFSR